MPPAFFHDGTTRVAGTTGLPHSDMIYSLDLTVGALVAKLDELNVLRNSIVVRAVRHVNVPGRAGRGKGGGCVCVCGGGVMFGS